MENQFVNPRQVSRVSTAINRTYEVGGYRQNVVYAADMPGKRDVVYVVTFNAEDLIIRNKILNQLQRLLILDTSVISVMGHYLSFMSIMFKTTGDLLIEEVKNSGYDVVYVPWEEDGDFEKVEELEEQTMRYLLVRMGQLCMLPFKSFTTANYKKFINSRTRALCAKIGMEEKVPGLPCSMMVANMIRLRFGALNKFKQHMIRGLQSQELSNASVTGSMANYILSILEYTDMTAYHFILNILFRTKSPVIFCQSLATEVDNFLEAMDLVTRSSQPYFFSVFCHPAELALVQRGKFAMLFAIAIEIAGDMYTPIKQITGVANINSMHVGRYVEMHRINAGMNTHTMQIRMMRHIPRSVDYRLFEEQTNRKHLGLKSNNLRELLDLKKDFGGPVQNNVQIVEEAEAEEI